MSKGDVDYEIRVDGCMEAGSNDLTEALNYFSQYKGDGELVELVKVEVVAEQENPGFDRMAWLKRAKSGG